MPSTIAVILVLIVLAIIVVAWRGMGMRKLAIDGVEAPAVVLTKIRFRGKSNVPTYRLRYSFLAADGKTYANTISMTESEAAGLEAGSKLDVTYLPKSPGLSAASSMVALAAQALEKRK
jgi:hypothetical protein